FAKRLSTAGMSYVCFGIAARGEIAVGSKCAGLRNNVQELRAETSTGEGCLVEARVVDLLDGYEPPAVDACRISGFVLDIQLPADAKGLHLARSDVRLLCGEGVGRHFGGA